MSKKMKYITISDSLIKKLDYDDNYEIIWLMNILKECNSYFLAWGQTSIITTPSILLDSIVEREEPTRKLQASLLNSLESLDNKGVIGVIGEKLTWHSRIKINCSATLDLIKKSKTIEKNGIKLEELEKLFGYSVKEIGNLTKAYLYLLSRLNLNTVDSLVEHKGEITLYDFDQNDNFNFTFVSDTIDYMRCRKNHRIECENKWIGKKQLSDTLKTLSDIGVIKYTTRSIANGSNKGLITKRNFYYLPCIEEWKMEKVIDRYVARKNWIETNKHTPQS